MLRRTLFNEIDPTPSKTWLADGWLGAGEMSIFFGAPSSGKSALVTDLAVRVAWGSPWHGRQVLHGAVLYVAAERAAVVKRRLAAVRKYWDLPDLPLAVLQGGVDLRSTKAIAEEIVGHCNELADTFRLSVVLVIIDTVSRALASGDENSPKDMGALIGNAALIQQATGAHVCLVHHIPQDGTQRLRGHGSLLGAADTTIAVEKGTTARTATIEKANDAEEGQRIAFTLESVEIADDGTTAPVVLPADMPERTTKSKRRLLDKDRAAIDVLSDICIDGKALANGNDLPADIRAVPVDQWRDELYRRGVLDKDHSSPREDFRRVKTKLIARHLVGERDGWIWAA